MSKKKLLVPLFLLCFSSAVVAQDLGRLRSWAGKYPTERKGKVTTSFFGLPEIRTPLLRLLSRTDFNLLTKEYGVATPIKQIGDYLAVKVCRPHNCDGRGRLRHQPEHRRDLCPDAERGKSKMVRLQRKINRSSAGG